jgi:GT2 family glycosyltransferase
MSAGPLRFGNETLIFEGVVERLGGGWATGWVWMPGDPGRRLSVEIATDERPLTAGLACLYREDLAGGDRGDGYYGFHLPLPATVGPSPHVRIANTAFRLPIAETIESGPAALVTRGAVDQAFGLTVKGWCWAPAEAERTISVTATLDGEAIASAPADEFRLDLANAGIGDGRHAFVLRLPFSLADGKVRSVALHAEDGRVLMGSPIEVQAMPEGPLAVLEDARRAVGAGTSPDHSFDLLKVYLARVEELIPQSLPWRDYEQWRPAHPPPALPEPVLAPGSLTLLDGGVVALLDAGAEPRPGAVARACAVFHESGADLLYGDAEAETSLGLMPWFRPDWSYDLFLAQNYLRGLVLIRTSLLRHLPPSATPADTLMAAVEASRQDKIRHLPEVLTRLTAPANDENDWLTTINSHLSRRAHNAWAEALPSGDRRIHWPLPAQPPGISLIIPTRDRLDLLAPCIDSIRRLTRYSAYEIIVVDNQSRDPDTLRYLAEGQARGIFRVLAFDAPFNFAAMNNEAAKSARGAILGFINNDVELITRDWLEQAAGLLARPEVGAVGAKLRFANGMIQHAGVTLGIGGLAENAFQHLRADEAGYFNRTNVAGNYSAVTAACLFTRAESFAAIGGFDAANLPVAFNDVDLCLRLRERGLSIVWTPHIELYHHESVSRGRDASEERRARAYKEEAYMRHRWRGILLNDPFYNPNLNLDQRPFTGLAFPPRRRWGGSCAPIDGL